MTDDADDPRDRPRFGPDDDAASDVDSEDPPHAGTGDHPIWADGEALDGSRAPLDPADLERLFDILDAAVGRDALPEAEQDQVLSVLEAVVRSPTRVEGDELDRLLSVLESAIVDPTDPETAEEVLAVLEATVVNPARLDPTETEGVLSVLESAVVDPTDPGSTAREVFSLFDALGLDDPDTTPAADRERDSGPGAVDPADPLGSAESLLDAIGLGASGDRSREGPADEGDTEGTADASAGPATDPGERTAATTGGDLDRPFRVARLVAAATQRTTDYSLRSGVRMGTGLVSAVRESESLDELVDETRAIAFEELDRLGVDVGETTDAADEWAAADRLLSAEVLRERGARLLELSADVDHDESIHPAFPRVLNELAADEARILRLLATEGPQPSVDIRDVGWVPISSELVAAGLSMIGAEAGCRHEGRTPAYLNNLKRLGLVWFSDEPVRNVKRYQVLQAQPHVADAIEECRRAKTIRRSIHLTPFGVDFCRVCLPVEVAAEDVAGAYEAPEDLTKE